MKLWDGKSKGTILGYKIFVFFIRVFGVSSAYFLLRFVSYYYYLFSQKNRTGLINFYQTALSYSEKEAKSLTKKNFFIFGQTLIDRTAFLVGKGNSFTYTFNHENYLMELINKGKGGLLLSGHLGNWEIAGNLLNKRITTNINVVMLVNEMEKIKKYVDHTTGGSRFKVIPIKNDLSHIISINNALSNNEMVAIHADRFMTGSKFFETNFLGKKAKFPLGPFLFASKFNSPISFVFAMKENKFHYSLSATKPITQKLSVEELLERYVAELENKVKQYPEQWFNHYNFFS